MFRQFGQRLRAGVQDHRLKWAARIAALALLYFVLGRMGLELAHYQDNATLIWPPTGLALAALILFGRNLWPGVFIGALAVNVWVGTGWIASLAIASGNTLEAVVGSFLLVVVAGFRPDMARVQDVVNFLVVGALVTTMISATVGVGVLWVVGELGSSAPGLVWLIWWLGDVGGAVVFTPVLLLSARGTPAWGSLVRLREAWIVLLCLGLGTTLAFSGIVAEPWALLAAFVPFPFIVWSGVRLGPRGAVMASSVTALAAALGTAQGTGPFVEADTHTSLMLLWAYGMTIGAAGLTLAAAIAERERVELLRRKADESRLRLEKKMYHSQRLEGLGVLAGGVAHDFNNILMAIRCNADLAEQAFASNDAGVEKLRRIRLASDRAADLCRQLLAYAGKDSTTKTKVSLAHLIDETNSLLEASVSKRVFVETGNGHELPVIDGDPTLLGQVVMNLVINAAEAVEDGPGTVRVRTHATQLDQDDLDHIQNSGKALPGAFVCLEVWDDGEGMDGDTVERMFDPFFTTKFKGRGLGLASVLGIVQDHNGAIQVQSDPGRGTVVRVFLPMGVESPEAITAEVTKPLKDGEGRVVLLADDEPQVLAVIREVLEAAGYRVLAVRSGMEAVESFVKWREDIDALVLDVNMPGLTGVEALDRIRAVDGEIPALLMSGFEPPAAAPTASAPRPDAFIRKPFPPGGLLEPLENALSARQGKGQVRRLA